MSEAFSQIERTWLLADRLHDAMFAAATSTDERIRITSARDSARDAYWAAAAKTLADNNAMVVSIRASLDDANGRLEAEIDNMESFAAALNMLTKAVQLAASLVTLAGI
ncbi:MAG: hypothetical protein ABIW83_06790 [Allosphingosinicella sp.]